MIIDWWTLGFQAVNVVVLVWLLQRFFWRPVAGMIELRRTTADKALADAMATQGKATAALAYIATTRAGFGKERDTILAAAHADAETASKAVLDAAAKDATARADTAAAAMKAEHDANQAAWSDRAAALAVEIAGRLASRLQGPAVSSLFLDWLVSSIRAMPGPARVAAVTDAGGMEAVTAAPLGPAEQEQARTAIAAAFGIPPQVTFRADPALLAGIELHGPHFALNNSWRADLDEILKTIRHAPGR